MQPDNHAGQAQTRNTASKTRQVVTSGGARPLGSSVAALVGLFGLAALPLVGCGDDDTTGIMSRGGSSGAAGSAGSGGSAGNGGSAGSAGSAGAAGAAGAAGTAGAGGDTFDGAAVAAAICATMGQLAGSDPGDAGPDAAAPDGGDAGSPAAEGCAPSATCVDEFTAGTFDYFETTVPACRGVMQAYFGCMATQPVSAYTCVDGIPNINLGNHGCVAEENAFNEGVVDDCAD